MNMVGFSYVYFDLKFCFFVLSFSYLLVRLQNYLHSIKLSLKVFTPRKGKLYILMVIDTFIGLQHEIPTRGSKSNEKY